MKCRSSGSHCLPQNTGVDCIILHSSLQCTVYSVKCTAVSDTFQSRPLHCTEVFSTGQRIVLYKTVYSSLTFPSGPNHNPEQFGLLPRPFFLLPLITLKPFLRSCPLCNMTRISLLLRSWFDSKPLFNSAIVYPS